MTCSTCCMRRRRAFRSTGVLGHHEHFVEEAVDGGTDLRGFGERLAESHARFHGMIDGGPTRLQLLDQRLLGRLGKHRLERPLRRAVFRELPRCVFTRLKSVAKVWKSAVSVNSGSTSSLRRASRGRIRSSAWCVTARTLRRSNPRSSEEVAEPFEEEIYRPGLQSVAWPPLLRVTGALPIDAPQAGLHALPIESGVFLRYP